jgi:endonuclease/exonuclease/phosphatase family metal-dependent hydrolase
MRHFHTSLLGLALLAFGALPASAQETERLTIASWNVAHFYADPSEYDGKLAKYERSSDDLALLQAYASDLDADVIVFQELDSEAAATILLPQGYCFEASPRDSGNPISSRQRVVVAFRAALVSDADGCRDRVTWHSALGLEGDHLRFGADFALPLGTDTIRFLGLHLKSACHANRLDLEATLESDASRRDRREAKACARFAAQAHVLNDWIEARVAEGGAFMLLGDFNRRFDAEGAEHDGRWVWPMLSDGDPIGQSLVRPTRFQKSPCWRGEKYERYIDHFVMNERAAALVTLGSFSQPVYDAPFAGDDEMGWRLSDHCAIRITLSAPGEPAS